MRPRFKAQSLLFVGSPTGLLALASLTALILGSSARAADDHLPPVGQRAYLIDAAQPYAPVEIERKNDAPQGGHFLKDPMQPGHALPLKPRLHPQVIRRPAEPAMKPGTLQFGKLHVVGHVKQPRIDFTRESMPMQRADEPQNQDFFQKVYAPAKDDQF